MKNILLLFLFLCGGVLLYSQSDAGQADEESGDDIEKSLVFSDDGGAQAQTGKNARSAASGDSFSFSDFLRMFLILCFVILLIYGVFSLLKKAGTNKFGRDNDLIKIISSKAISADKSLHLAEIGEHIFFIGASENSISCISEISDKETLALLKLSAPETENPKPETFRSYLMKLLKPGTKIKNISFADSMSLIKENRDRLKKL